MKKRSIYLKVWAAALALVVVVGACKDDDKPLPAIDGYNSADDIASSNLVAHWTFDDDTRKESISGATPTSYGTVSTVAGQIGNALNLQRGAIKYPSLDRISTANALGNYTISLWINVKGHKKVAGSGNGALPLFSLISSNATDIWGNINALVETGGFTPSSDSIVLKTLMQNHQPGGVITDDDISGVNGGTKEGQHVLTGNKWSHFVITWTGSSHSFAIYSNGVKSGAYDERGDNSVALIMDVPVLPVFGSLAATDIGFTSAPARSGDFPMAEGMVDEVRVYNTVLSQAEISSLFNFGTAGR